MWERERVRARVRGGERESVRERARERSRETDRQGHVYMNTRRERERERDLAVRTRMTNETYSYRKETWTDEKRPSRRTISFHIRLFLSYLKVSFQLCSLRLQKKTWKYQEKSTNRMRDLGKNQLNNRQPCLFTWKETCRHKKETYTQDKRHSRQSAKPSSTTDNLVCSHEKRPLNTKKRLTHTKRDLADNEPKPAQGSCLFTGTET